MDSMKRIITDEMRKVPEGVSITNVSLNVAGGRGNVEFKSDEFTYQLEFWSNGTVNIVGETKEKGVYIRYYGIRALRPYQFLLGVKETIEEIIKDSQVGVRIIREEYFKKEAYSITYSEFEKLVILKERSGETEIIKLDKEVE